MSVLCKAAEAKDIPALLQIEHETMPANCYLAAVAEKFLDASQGVLLKAEVDGVPAGVAHLAWLSDGGSWLEVLRVTPALQKHGAGTAIWEEAIRLAEENGRSCIRMYTGEKNVTSRRLAERFGLSLACSTREAVLTADKCVLSQEEAAAAARFAPVSDSDAAEALALPLEKDYGGYFCRNRTFWNFGKALFADLCAQGSFYAAENALIDIGARMQLDKGLHIGLMGGALDADLAFAKAMLLRTGLPRLVAMIGRDDAQRSAALESRGFVFGPSGIIMLEKKF